MKKEEKPFICNKCNKGFAEDRYLQRHQKRKTPCTAEHKCLKCNKIFKTNALLLRHLNRQTSCVVEEIPVVTNDNIENRCHMCGNYYSNKQNLNRHQKTCSVLQNPSQLMRLMVEKEKETKLLLEEQDKKWEQRFIQMTGMNPTQLNLTNIDNSTTNITNNVQNNNMYVNVTLCCFGNEDLTKLDKNKVLELVKNHEKDFIPKMIEHVHANPDMPEYHNVFFDTESGNAIVFVQVSGNEKSWEPRDFNTVSTELTQKIKEHVMPGRGPYFDIASQAKDYDTGNAIIRIARHVDWNTPEVLVQNQEALSKIQHNTGFNELVKF